MAKNDGGNMNSLSAKYWLLACFLLTIWLTGCSQQGSAVAYGILDRDTTTLLATSNALIVAIPVQEGEQVKTGDLLVQLDKTKQLTNLALAKAKAKQAQARLAKLQNGERQEDIQAAIAGVKAARASLLQSQLQLKRDQELMKSSSISQTELDNATAQYDASKANYEIAQQALKKITNGSREEDIQLAMAEVEATQASVAYEQAKLEELAIRATTDGLLDSLPFQVGDRVTLNSILAVVQSDSPPFARVYVPEPFLANLTIGQQMSVMIDGVTQTMNGRLRWISMEPAFTPYRSMSEQDRSRLVYLTEVDVPEAKGLPSGIPLHLKLN